METAKRKLKELRALKKKPKKRFPGGRGKPMLGYLEEDLVSSNALSKFASDMQSNTEKGCRILRQS